MALRVALVDDHRLIREGLKSFLTGRGIEIVGEGSVMLDCTEAARLADCIAVRPHQCQVAGAIASAALASASSMVSPAEMQPGRSGKLTP